MTTEINSQVHRLAMAIERQQADQAEQNKQLALLNLRLEQFVDAASKSEAERTGLSRRLSALEAKTLAAEEPAARVGRLVMTAATAVGSVSVITAIFQ